jgi:hypothetical protein
MMNKHRIPRNPDCPLTKKEREQLIKQLDLIQWRNYVPYKWSSSGYCEVKVTEYDEETINVSILHGVDGDRHFEDEEIIERETLIIN